MTIAGMSIGSWVLIIIIAIWAFIAIKVYFFGGFKKGKNKAASIGACCDTGDADSGTCAKCNGCDEKAVRQNTVLPTFKQETK